MMLRWLLLLKKYFILHPRVLPMKQTCEPGVLNKVSRKKLQLLDIYTRLFIAFGSRNWWPADTAEEVIFGAILTQNTSWKNAEQALAALKANRKLRFKTVAEMDIQALAELIRPARFLNQKAKALKTFAGYLGSHYGFSIKKMGRKDIGSLREELLSLYRIGPETADSILCYALEKPVFVIDVYTKRIFSRHGFLKIKDSYDDYQRLFMENLSRDVQLYNEYHALLVLLGNRFCKPKPLCAQCPLKHVGALRSGS
jgi:endonuclease-3 related protein